MKQLHEVSIGKPKPETCKWERYPEPDQIDMMDADELRSEFRKLLKLRDELLAELENIMSGSLLDKQGNRDEDGIRRRFNWMPEKLDRFVDRLDAAIAKAQGGDKA